MSFNYNKIRSKRQSNESQWASYSDLFMVLAFIFLLLYLVASFRTGMMSITANIQLKHDKEKLLLYESVKNEYLAKKASKKEKALYQEIVNKISVLESETVENKNRLAQEYNEQIQREASLNRYQQMLIAMVDANMVAKVNASEKIAAEKQQNFKLSEQVNQYSNDLATLENRLESNKSKLLALKETHSSEINSLENKYQGLKGDYDKRRNELELSESKIKSDKTEMSVLKKTHKIEINSLESKYQGLKGDYNKHLNELASLENKIKSSENEKSVLEKSHASQINSLKNKYQGLKRDYDNRRNELMSLESKIKSDKIEISSLKKTHSSGITNLKNKYQNLKKDYEQRRDELAAFESKVKSSQNEISTLKNTHTSEIKNIDNKYQGLKGDYEKSRNELASLENKVKAGKNEIKALKNTHSSKIKNLDNKYQGLKGDYNKNRNELASLENKVKAGKNEINALKDAHSGEIKNLDNKYQGLKGDYEKSLNKTAKLGSDLNSAKARLQKSKKDLNKALEMANRRRDLAKRIKDNFKSHGINAEVDSGTGDVILDFGEDYFDYNSHDLNSGMKKTILDAIPLYAQSLFAKKELAKNISSVEIIGFASPTFLGKPVNPTSLSLQNRTAINYNLDLSYKRARSIFEYVFDTNSIKFNHQNTMLPLIKVTGRSFFTEKIDPKDTGVLSKEEFCNLYNCTKSQRVIIKFGLSE